MSLNFKPDSSSSIANAAGISTGPNTHLDHLGVLCSLIKIPLIVSEEKNYSLARLFYPDLKVIYKDYQELSLDYLASSFDILFGCGKFWALDLLPTFSLLQKKIPRLVFCPHGNSDKGHSLPPECNTVSQDISLVYGQHMLDLLKANGSLDKINRIIRTGNYRYPFYLTHKTFYDSLAQEKVFSSFDSSKKNILYTPTWPNKENPSSFFEICKEVIEQLTPFYNVLIKLHPFLEEHYPALTFYLISKYENTPRLVFLTDFPAIYPLLSKTDIYLGDFSSVGYDFLAFDKPLYFFSETHTSSLSLHLCGRQIIPSERKNLYSFIQTSQEEDQHLFSSIRKQVYHYAFGENRDAEELIKEISIASGKDNRLLSKPAIS